MSAPSLSCSKTTRMAPQLVQTLPTTKANHKRALTEADLPPLPPQLGSTATASEKAARAAIMQERRRVQKQLLQYRSKGVAIEIGAVASAMLIASVV